MPPAAEFLPKPRDGDDPRDRAWRCRRPLGRLREKDVGCSSDRSVSSEGFLGPADATRTLNTNAYYLVPLTQP